MIEKQPYLSVIIPAYNEKTNFNRGALEKVRDYLGKQNYSWEVIVVDDGSTDGSPVLLQDFCRQKQNFHFIANEHMGKAGTVSRGVQEANGQYVLFTDFD